VTVSASWLLAAEAASVATAGTFTPGRDLLLDDDGDLVLGADFQMTTGLAAVAQDIRLRIRLFRGEWFRNVDHGVPWEQEILGHKPTMERLYSIFRTVIFGSFEVQSIRSLTIELSSTRVLTVVWEVHSTFGIIADELEF